MSFVIIPKILWTISLAALVLSAATDLRERLIPNEFVVLVMLCGILLCLAVRPGQICLSLVAAAVTFLALGILSHYDAIGGGDVKLMAAVTLLVPPGQIGELLIGITLAGGLLSAVYLGASYMLGNSCAPYEAAGEKGTGSFAEWSRAESIRIASRKEVPYAVAILGGVIWYVARESLPCSSAMPCWF